MFGLLKNIFRKPPRRIPDVLWQRTCSRHACLSRLTVDTSQRLKTLTERFLDSKEFTPAGDLVMTDEICLSIAAQGCLPVLELGLDWYDDWVGIIVYPGEFRVPRHLEDEDGVVHQFDDVLSGEAWGGGPLILSWQDVRLHDPGYNVVLHEFAHKLDLRNGEADGVPPLANAAAVDAWEQAFFPAYEDFCQQVDRDEETTLDPYASEHPSEFFAVLTEVFFETPDVLAQTYPALYAQYAAFFRQDPREHPAQAA